MCQGHFPLSHMSSGLSNLIFILGRSAEEWCWPRASFIDTTVAGGEDDRHQHEDTEDHARHTSPTTNTEPTLRNA